MSASLRQTRIEYATSKLQLRRAEVELQATRVKLLVAACGLITTCLSLGGAALALIIFK
jgi:hypothetical protein